VPNSAGIWYLKKFTGGLFDLRPGQVATTENWSRVNLRDYYLTVGTAENNDIRVKNIAENKLKTSKIIVLGV
jgi:hypothetical protein